jgi:3'-5' exonuclease
MSKLVIDIETVGKNLKDLDKVSQEYFKHWADDNEMELDKVEEGFSLSPLTAEVVVIGMYNPTSENGIIYYQNPDKPKNKFKEGSIEIEAVTEEEMLKKFWSHVKSYDEFITFNGRGFDIPFLLLRSAVHKIRPSKNLMSNRYLNSQFSDAKHIDLQDQLKFYGAVWGKGYNLHMYCEALGIKSPKQEGVSGAHVKEMFDEGRYDDIAKYNIADLYATAELYKAWQQYINV